MNPSRMTDEQVAAELRDRVTAAENRVDLPPDLMSRVTAPRRPRPRRSRGRWSTLVVAAAAVIGIAAGVAATAITFRATEKRGGPAAGETDVTITVYNAEVPCQPLRTMECSFGVLRDPYQMTPDRVVDRVWHGDRLTALCVVANGVRVGDETGVTSVRWYKVRTPNDIVGYLPGVRTRNTVEVRLCP